LRGSMVGAGRVLTASPAMVVRRAEDGPCAAHAAALDIASLFTGMVLFPHLMEPTYDKNSINTIFTHIQ
jgi:hypothetical protein